MNIHELIALLERQRDEEYRAEVHHSHAGRAFDRKKDHEQASVHDNAAAEHGHNTKALNEALFHLGWWLNESGNAIYTHLLAKQEAKQPKETP